MGAGPTAGSGHAFSGVPGEADADDGHGGAPTALL